MPPTSLQNRIIIELNAAPSALLARKQMRALHKHIRYNKNPDYDLHWAAFSHEYFTANYLKCAFAMTNLRVRRKASPIKVLDLGCGGGASSAAALVTLRKQYGKKQPLHITGVDINHQQISHYTKTFLHWATSQSLVNVNFHQGDAHAYLHASKTKWDIIIVSYLLTELKPQERRRITALLNKRSKKDKTVVICVDRHLKTGQTYFTHSFKTIINPSLDSLGLDLQASSIARCGAQPKYGCNKREPTSLRRMRERIIERYFHVWRAHDIKGLKKLFTKNSTYNINGTRTLTGVAEIKHYWERNAKCQKHVAYKIVNHHVCRAHNTVEWTATFFRKDKSLWYYLHGLLWVTSQHDTIKTLTEFYWKRTSKTPLNSRMATLVGNMPQISS